MLLLVPVQIGIRSDGTGAQPVSIGEYQKVFFC